MNILFVCAFLGHHGGFENNVEAYAQVALESGHSVLIITPQKLVDDATLRESLSGKVRFTSAQEYWRAKPHGKLAYTLANIRHSMRQRQSPTPAQEALLAREWSRGYTHRFWDTPEARALMAQYDIIHLFGKPKNFVSDAAVLGRALGKRVMYTEVAGVNEEYARVPEHQKFTQVSNQCDLLIGYCPLHERDMRRWFQYNGKFAILDQWAFGVEDELLAIQRDFAPKSELVFGTLCRLGPEKGLDTLVKAFAIAHQRHPNLRLRIAGKGPLEATIRQLCREFKIESHVELLDYVPHKDGFYADIDVFVVNSIEEGGPITGLEAMAAALPMITTPVGAMPDRVTDGQDALITPVGDIDALAARMIRLVEDTALRESLGTAARHKYLQCNHSTALRPQMVALWNI